MGELDLVLTPRCQNHVGLKDNVMDTDRVLRFLDLAQREFEAGCETWMWCEYGGRKRVARIVPVYDMTRRAVTLDAIY
jgi:hypothetical protein